MPTKQTDRIIIKGTFFTYREDWFTGCDRYSSILLSVINGWLSKNYSSNGELMSINDSWKARHYGQIKYAIYGYTSDLHNISINFSLLKDILEDSNIDGGKRDLFACLLLENYFTNLRSLYDFLSKIIKISLTDKQLKTYPDTDSLNSVIKFSKKKNNHEKLPENIRNVLPKIELNLREISSIRDKIIHKGKEILLIQKGSEFYIRIPSTGLFGNENILPNVIDSNEIDFNLNEYLRVITKKTFSCLEEFGEAMLIEIFEKDKIIWNYYAISNYCIDEFNDFMLNQRMIKIE